MSLFTIIPDAVVILNSKGVFKQVKVYSREGLVYAQWGGGFIGLRNYENGTTLPDVRWEHLEGVEYKQGSTYGRMELKTHRRLREVG